jgi:hypothetical protein
MQATLNNRKNIVVESPRSVIKRKNKIEEGGASGSRVKKKHENT